VSYLHCPTCACAYNVAREPTCPRCGIRPGTPAEPTEDIVVAVEQLARAMARATPIEVIAAQSVLDARAAQLALPAPGQPTAPSPSLLRAVRAALDSPQGRSKVDALFDHVSPDRRTRWRAAIDAALARLSPRLPAATETLRSTMSFARFKSRVMSFARSRLTA
jgi:hypothetical protein